MQCRVSAASPFSSSFRLKLLRIAAIDALILALAVGGVLPTAGCTSAVVVSAGMAAGFRLAQLQASQFVNGKLEAGRMVPVDPSQAAVRAAMTELQMTIKTDRRKRRGATIVGQSPGGPKVRVSLSQISPIATKFEIRVGVFGDQAVSQLTMDGIDRFLQSPETLRSPVEPAACAGAGPIDPDREVSISD